MHMTGYLKKALIAAFAWSSAVHGVELKPVPKFGFNPSNITMNIYLPDNLAPNPPVVVAMHTCAGSAQMYFRMTKNLSSYADKLGFIIIYPATTALGSCWDTVTAKSKRRNAGSDSDGLVSMIKYTLSTYNGDPKRVFAFGSSSGAHMANVIASTYPDIFAGCAVFSGLPVGCCQTRQAPSSAKQLGDIVRSYYPGYNGPRPRMQIWHGTADRVNTYSKYFKEELEQWSNVLGVTLTRNVSNTPLRGYTEMIYGDGTKLVAYSAEGVGHVVPFQEEPFLKSFGLM